MRCFHSAARAAIEFLLIGATGLTGQEIVEQGLALGHAITVLVRDVSKVARSDSHLYLLAGDIFNPVEMDAAMAEQHAVICTLGTGVTFKRHREQERRCRCKSDLARGAAAKQICRGEVRTSAGGACASPDAIAAREVQGRPERQPARQRWRPWATPIRSDPGREFAA